MASDDPVEIVIQQARVELEEESYLPSRLLRLGVSCVAAAALARHPVVSQIVATLLLASPPRFEERFIRVLEEMDAQQKRIEDKIPDKRFYESEEFQTLFWLILERLHTTHDQKKLKMFGDALANSGSSEFRDDDREQFIRVLRDLSRTELETLNDHRLKEQVSAAKPIQYDSAELTRFSRLVGMGLVHEQRISGLDGGPKVGRDRIYALSDFGASFLRFISDENEATQAQN